jgi:hypothetical protein
MEQDELLSVEGLIVEQIKRGEVKLQAPGGEGIIIRVEFEPGSDVARRLKLDDQVGVRGEAIYNRLSRMKAILHTAFPDPAIVDDSDIIELPGVTGTYPNPLRLYPQLLGKNLERKSYVHGDLHLRNVLVDESGTGWLIDYARVEERHNLFDFIKLETYVRTMVLANVTPSLSLCDYVRLEEALNDATLKKKEGTTCPDNTDLDFAHKVILVIRRIAQKYMGPKPDFRDEYFTALFLYCLAVIKYHRDKEPRPTQIAFTTACVLGKYIRGLDKQSHPITPSVEPEPRLLRLTDILNISLEHDGCPHKAGSAQWWIRLRIESKKPICGCWGKICDIRQLSDLDDRQGASLSEFHASRLSWGSRGRSGLFAPISIQPGDTEYLDLAWRAHGDPSIPEDRLLTASALDKGERNTQSPDWGLRQDFIPLEPGYYLLVIQIWAKGYDAPVKCKYRLHWPGPGQEDDIRLTEIADAQPKAEKGEIVQVEKAKGGSAISDSTQVASDRVQSDKVGDARIEIDSRSGGVHFEGQAPVHIKGDVVGHGQTKISYETHFHTDNPHISLGEWEDIDE